MDNNIPVSKTVGIFIQRSERKNNLVARQFIGSFIIKYGKHPVYLDGNTWYPEAFNVLTLH